MKRPTKADIETITTRYDLVDKNYLAFEKMPSDMKPTLIDTSLPLDLQQARHAVRIAKWSGADKYAADVMSDAEDLLYKAEEYFVHKAGDRLVSMASRETVQNAEDARLIAMKRRSSR